MRHYGIRIPNNMASGKAFEDLDLSKDEVNRLGEALKDENFRKMFAEYAEEISDPENRRKAEEEIKMMEQERGMNVQFVHPNPGHVLKTTVDGTTKAFINVCQNDKIDKPVAKREVDPSGKSGLMWQIPHSFAPPREDLDKGNGKCKVFDVVFHPDTYRMASNNERFKKLVEDTAVDGIEKQFNVTLDKKNIRYPKLTYKGQPVATVIRERIPDGDVEPAEPDSFLGKMPYPYENKTTSEKSKEKTTSKSMNGVNKEMEKSVNGNDNKFTEPKYTITHRSDLDMSEYRNAPDAKISTRPKELVIKICLPLLKSAADASLDIFEKRVILESVLPAAYKLDLNLPFPVNEDEGYAKFDKFKKTLTITLPVIQEKVPELPFTHRGEGDSFFNSQEDEARMNNELITVLSDTNHDLDASDAGVGIKELNGLETATEPKTQVDGKTKLPEHVKWLLPEYETLQDYETVSFVLKVQCIEEGSVALTFPEEHSVEIKFMSIGAGCFPSYYSLRVEFCDRCRISSDHCNVDVSGDNLVLLLLKDKTCRGLWDFYSIGTDKDNLEIKQFLTERNLKRELAVLDKKAAQEDGDMPGQDQAVPEVSVLEMSSEKLTMEIKPKHKKGKKSLKVHKVEEEEEEDDEYDYDPPSSAEIEVVHRRPAPLLHSILKQRTVSESSEDHSLTAELDSPRSAEEDELSSSFGKRRSVSFNSHVDRASFKTNASVSSMGPALKSKRKRQRRRDEKIQRGQRQRNNSGTSSGEEHGARKYSSDSYSLSEEDGEESEKPVLRSGALMRANSDPGPDRQGNDANRAREKSENVMETKNGEKQEEATDVVKTSVIPHSSECLDFRTKYEGKEIHDVRESCESVSKSATKEEDSDTQEDRNKKMTEEIKGKLEAAKIDDDKSVDERVCDSDDDDDDDKNDDNVSVSQDAAGAERDTSVASAVKCGDSDQRECGDGRKQGEGKTVSETDKSDSNSGGGDIVQAGKEMDEDAGDGKTDENKVREKSDVETVLSWNDKAVNGDDHRTQCAFAFSNNIMFDLDVD